MASTGKVDHDVIVIGAGFGGIRALWECQKLGLSVKAFEAGSDVGGAWYWNRYPGARTDSEAWVYTFNFAPEVKDEWDYQERYPSQESVQRYLGHITDHFGLRKYIQFNTRVAGAYFDDNNNTWTITTKDGHSETCRYFIPATGPLSAGREPPFRGLNTFKGEWYLASTWPKKDVDFRGKRVAVIGTGATGVQIVPKIAPVAKTLTVFQRTANYVLPGRNYNIDKHQAQEIKQNYDSTWNQATNHGFGLAMNSTGKTVEDTKSAEEIRKVLDAGWESGGFHIQFETFDDIFTSHHANEVVSEYLREKIRAIVQDPKTADLLSPKYPFLSKRPPCGHFYFETFNRPNVKLVDISKDDIELNEKGIVTQSGQEFEFDLIIFAIGFDAATGALDEIDIKGSQGKSLKDTWTQGVKTFAGVLTPGFPNLFLIAGPHIPFGNMPVVLEQNVDWIGKALSHMKKNNIASIDIPDEAADAWSRQLDAAFNATVLAESAKSVHAWFVGGNIPGKRNDVLFYFGGVPSWVSWLKQESENGWPTVKWTPQIAEKSSVEESKVKESNWSTAEVSTVA